MSVSASAWCARALLLALAWLCAPRCARAQDAQVAGAARDSSSTSLTAPAELTSAQRAAAARAPLRALLAAAGGLAAYEQGAGLGFDLLETTQVLVQRERAQWGVHSRLAQRVVFDRAGRGYAWIEYASFDAGRASAAPRMQRAVWNGEQAWTESSGVLDVSPGAAERARVRLERAQLLGALPFSLLALECAGAYASIGAARLGEERVERWRARLAVPVDWGDEGRFEWIELALDEARVRRLSLVPAREPAAVGASGEPRAAPELVPDERAALHFDCEPGLECGALRLPRRVLAWRMGEERRTLLEFAAAEREPVPPEALRLPGAREAYYAPPRRAASWDAPRAFQQPAQPGR